jgi:hypothetical protein
MSWFTKDKAVQAAVARKPVHVSHEIEALIADLLCEHGRLQRKSGRHLMHFTATSRNSDGSVDYLVRTRLHSEHGMERNFDSHVRIYADRRLKLIR